MKQLVKFADSMSREPLFLASLVGTSVLAVLNVQAMTPGALSAPVLAGAHFAAWAVLFPLFLYIRNKLPV